MPQDVKVFSVRTNLVPGYITARLEPRLPWTVGTKPFAGNNVAYALAATTIQVRNLSSEYSQQATAPDGFAADVNDVVLQFQETDDDSPSGVRTKLSSVAVKAGGTASVTVTPQRQFFEVKGLAGNGPVSLEFQTKMDWNERGFSEKLDSLHPSNAWDTADLITVKKTATQTFTSNTVWAVTHNLGYIATPTLISSAGVDITALATFSSITVNGYTATFGGAQAGTAYSTP